VRTQTAGFHFEYPTLHAALTEIYPPVHRQERRFATTQFLPRSVKEIFPFFSRAENLEELTPPWLKFHVLSKSTPKIEEQTLIDYRLRIHGVPWRWRTRIESFIPNQRFVDTQLRGPYARWHHTHCFEAVPGGTLVHDEVFYKLPGGAAGQALAGSFVRRDVEQIFDYRRRKLAEIFH
jgi:ligand-binding SRPBCC domain-containing protein